MTDTVVKASVLPPRQGKPLISILVPTPGSYSKKAFQLPLFRSKIAFNPVKGTVIYTENKVLASSVQVTELARGFKLAFPITLRIEKIEESLFVAECPTFNISIPAESYEDALDEIKEVLVDDYQAFLSNYPHKLTKEALNTLRLYCAFFGEALPKSDE